MLLAEGSPEEAFRLVGASDALRESIGSARPDYQEAEFEDAMERARARLGPSAVEAQEAGRGLDTDSANHLALDLCHAIQEREPQR
jgi:hypothetical protein